MGADRKLLLRQKLNAGSAWGLDATFSLPTSASFLRPIQWRAHTALSLKLKWPSWLLRCSFKVFWLLTSHQDHSGIQSGIQSGIHLSIRALEVSFIRWLIQSGTLPLGPGGCQLLMTFYYRPIQPTDQLTVSLYLRVSCVRMQLSSAVSRYAINAFYLMSTPLPTFPRKCWNLHGLWFIDSIYGTLL